MFWPTCVAVLVLLLAIAYRWGYVSASIENSYENVAYAVDPSPQRAFDYGEAHFDPRYPGMYDLDRAQYFFQLAARQDPTLPYLYHQLARISFLQGNFTVALSEINLQLQLHGDSEPAAYYVRGLIEGYMGDYIAAANNYQRFLQFEPDNWAAKNDEAWVLLKADEYQQALQVINSGLTNAPANAWLLNSKATALYELGDYPDALAAAQSALTAADDLTPQKWSTAYPGNDPAIATRGLSAFQADVVANIHTIQLAAASSTVQSK